MAQGCSGSVMVSFRLVLWFCIIASRARDGMCSDVVAALNQPVERVFPVARHILLPLLLEIYPSAILLSGAQRHRASTG